MDDKIEVCRPRCSFLKGAFAASVVCPYSDDIPFQVPCEGVEAHHDGEKLLSHYLFVLSAFEGAEDCWRWLPVGVSNGLDLLTEHSCDSRRRTTGIAEEFYDLLLW